MKSRVGILPVFFTSAILSVVCFSSVACGQSPLLHHHDAGDLKRDIQAAKVGIEECSLSFSKAGLCAQVEWVSGPKKKGESVFLLRFRNAAGELVDIDGALEVELDMPAMKHGSAPTAITRVLDAEQKVQTGVYKVSNCYFFMVGEWHVDVRIGTSAETTEAAAFETATMVVHL